MSDPPIHIEQVGSIARLVLNAPPRNAMDGAFFDTFRRLVARTLPTLDVRGLIVHGAGRHFSAGADIEELRARLSGVAGPPPKPGPPEGPATVVGHWARSRSVSRLPLGAEAGRRSLLETTFSFRALSDLPYPVVAAVGGCCFGSALELALACRYRVAAGNAMFALLETSFGLMAGCGASVRLPALVGLGQAIDLMLSGRTLLADEALRMGLIDLVVDRRDLVPSAERLIVRLAGRPRVAGPLPKPEPSKGPETVVGR